MAIRLSLLRRNVVPSDLQYLTDENIEEIGTPLPIKLLLHRLLTLGEPRQAVR